MIRPGVRRWALSFSYDLPVCRANGGPFGESRPDPPSDKGPAARPGYLKLQPGKALFSAFMCAAMLPGEEGPRALVLPALSTLKP